MVPKNVVLKEYGSKYGRLMFLWSLELSAVFSSSQGGRF